MQGKRTIPPKGPKAHPTKWTLASALTVHGMPDRVRLRRFDTQAEAEAALGKALEPRRAGVHSAAALGMGRQGPRLVAAGRRLMATKTEAAPTRCRTSARPSTPPLISKRPGETIPASACQGGAVG